jgi:hypothetical protein
MLFIHSLSQGFLNTFSLSRIPFLFTFLSSPSSSSAFTIFCGSSTLFSKLRAAGRHGSRGLSFNNLCFSLFTTT